MKDGREFAGGGYNDWNRFACYDMVYIASNIPLMEQYKNIQDNEPKTWVAFLRRIMAVHNFDISKEMPVSKYTGELKKPPTLIPIDDDSDLPFYRSAGWGT